MQPDLSDPGWYSDMKGDQSDECNQNSSYRMVFVTTGLEPFATLFHWDVPQALEDQYGGFLSPLIVDDFQNYAELCFKLFGDRMKHWMTIHEPWSFSLHGYSMGTGAPGHCSPWVDTRCGSGDSGREPYLVAHRQLLAHAAVFELYRNKYQHFKVRNFMAARIHTFYTSIVLDGKICGRINKEEVEYYTTLSTS